MTTHARTAGPSLWQEVVTEIAADGLARQVAAAARQREDQARRLVAFQKALVHWLTGMETTYLAPHQLDFELRVLKVEIEQRDDGPRAIYRGATFTPVPNSENTRDLDIHLSCPTCQEMLRASGERKQCLYQAIERHLATCCAGA